jgi:alpha-glutamyl/putrescinyl thymine pyrophosphorylase clade 1
MPTCLIPPEQVSALNDFIEERERVRILKEAGNSHPWTKDPILQEYKFCNVHREDDRTTRWITKNWREPFAADPDLWFAIVIARRALNWPGSMEALGYPVPWNPGRFIAVLEDREKMGEKSFDTAYQLLVQGQRGSKAIMMVKHILQPLWEAREELRPKVYDTLESFFKRLSHFKYMGLFYSGQVIADMKYTPVLQGARDWESFAVPGPGSERGLNRVLGRDKNTRWKKGEWNETLALLHTQIRMKMHAQDLQNCLCEFDKYERIKKNEGRVRPYKPTS